MVRIITDPVELFAAKFRERHLQGIFGKIATPGIILPFGIQKFEETLGVQEYCRFEGKDHSLEFAIDLGFDFVNARPPANILLFLPVVGPRGEDQIGGLILKFSEFEFGSVGENGTYVIFIYGKMDKAVEKLAELRAMVAMYCRSRN